MSKDVFAHIEDKELLDKFYSDGNNRWLGILLQRYTMLLLGVCMKYLKDEEEAMQAGVEDALNSGKLTLIEWADKFPDLLPDDCFHVQILVTGPESRRITL